MTRRLSLVALVVAMFAVLGAGCGNSSDPAPGPVPAPALDGNWNVWMYFSTTCAGTMAINGATGTGTFQGCVAVPGTVVVTAASSGGVTLVFQPQGYGAMTMNGMMTSATQIDGNLYGSGANGERFRAAHQ